MRLIIYYLLLLDCENVIYEPTITTLPFRICDKINQGVSPLCNAENEMVT
jgi:hypothetical protein